MKISVITEPSEPVFIPFKVVLEFNTQKDVLDWANMIPCANSFDNIKDIVYVAPVNQVTRAIKFRNL